MDFLINNGSIYDPAAGTFTKGSIAIVNGKLAAPEAGRLYRQVIDAAGCIVSPGLIDYHVHYYLHGSENSVNPDASAFCCGITTAVDSGTCGVGNYELYRRSIVAMSEVRIMNCLHVASGGQSNDSYPENLEPEHFDESRIVELFDKHRDNLVGLKTRLSRGIVSPETARASLSKTIEIAQKAGVRVVVHVTDCALGLDELAGMLRAGDVMCHIYHGRGEHTCLDRNGQVLAGLLKARERGVLFDASNGRSNFDIEICRKALAQGFTPDIISSDNNTSSYFLQPLHSLPRILSKFAALGMPLSEVLKAATLKPAELIGRPELGSLAEGTTADVAVFMLKRKSVAYSDINGHSLTGDEVLVPMMTFKSGKCMYCQADFA